MPIYEYKCHNCDHVFEKIVLNLEGFGLHAKCPACGHMGDKVVSRPAILRVK